MNAEIPEILSFLLKKCGFFKYKIIYKICVSKIRENKISERGSRSGVPLLNSRRLEDLEIRSVANDSPSLAIPWSPRLSLFANNYWQSCVCNHGNFCQTEPEVEDWPRVVGKWQFVGPQVS